jgi:hypothetical protein
MHEVLRRDDASSMSRIERVGNLDCKTEQSVVLDRLSWKRHRQGRGCYLETLAGVVNDDRIAGNIFRPEEMEPDPRCNQKTDRNLATLERGYGRQ